MKIKDFGAVYDKYRYNNVLFKRSPMLKNGFILIFFIIMVLSVTNIYAEDAAKIEITFIGIGKAQQNVMKSNIIKEFAANGITNNYDTNIGYYVKIIKIDKKIVINIQKIDTKRNVIISSEKSSTTSIDEVVAITHKLISKLKDYINIKTGLFIGLGASASYFGNYEFANAGYGLTLNGAYEIKDFRIDLNIYASNNYDVKYDVGEQLFALFNVSLNYLFIRDNITPYIGLGIGYGALFGEGTYCNTQYYPYMCDYTKDGFKIYEYEGCFVPLSVGMEFFRFYDVRLLLHFQANFPIEKFNNSSIDEKKRYIIPLYFALTFTFSFTMNECDTTLECFEGCSNATKGCNSSI